MKRSRLATCLAAVAALALTGAPAFALATSHFDQAPSSATTVQATFAASESSIVTAQEAGSLKAMSNNLPVMQAVYKVTLARDEAPAFASGDMSHQTAAGLARYGALDRRDSRDIIANRSLAIAKSGMI